MWGRYITFDLPCISTLDLSHVCSLSIPENRRPRKPIICLVKIFILNWILVRLHTVKARKPILCGFKCASNLVARAKSHWLVIVYHTGHKWTIWSLRPFTLRISALLLSKTYMCEPRSQYLDHSLITKPFVIT